MCEDISNLVTIIVLKCLRQHPNPYVIWDLSICDVKKGGGFIMN